MPTYEYRCNNCSHEFEAFQSMKDKPLRKCPECGKSALERLIGTGAAIVFKGSGFYQTDYRSESYKKAAEADSKSAKPAEKSETKPAADATAKADTSATKTGSDTKSTASETARPAPSKPSVRVTSKPAKTGRRSQK